jgi:hypothetical protein
MVARVDIGVSLAVEGKTSLGFSGDADANCDPSPEPPPFRMSPHRSEFIAASGELAGLKPQYSVSNKSQGKVNSSLCCSSTKSGTQD